MSGPVLVERDHELDLIRTAAASAAQLHGRAVVIEGEAGIGKTALLDAAAAMMRALGFDTYAARAGVFERTLGFGMARELFETRLARVAPDERSVLLSGSAGLARPLLDRTPDRGPLDAAGEHAILHGLYWLVANLAERSPVALLLDDAHWCDEPTLSWLLYLARRIADLPVVIALTVRTGERDVPGDLLGALRSEPASTVISLGPLGPAGTHGLIAAAYGSSIEATFSAACHEWTSGNPLFVTELASELAAAGIAPVGGSVAAVRRTPPTVARVTLLRLARLPVDAAALAQAFAILGSPATLDTAGALADLDRDRTLSAADALAEAHLLDDGEPPWFSHPLVADVVYADMTGVRRAAAHRRAAELLMKDGAPGEQIVTQLLRSPPAGDPAAADALLEGARRELANGSARTAITLLRRALAEPPRPTDRGTVLAELGRAESIAGDPAAIVTLQDALAAAEAPDERARIGLLLGRQLTLGGHNTEVVEMLESVIASLDDRAEDLRLQLTATVLTAARVDGRLAPVAARLAAQLHPDRLPNSLGGRLIAGQLAWVETAIGRSVARATELALQSLDEGRLIAESPEAPDAYLLPIFMLSFCDELDAADGFCRQALAQARGIGSLPSYAATICFQAGVSFRRGRIAEAELQARDAIRLAASLRTLRPIKTIAEIHLVNVLVARGELADADALLGPLLELTEAPEAWVCDLLAAAGGLRMAQRRTAEAASLLLACGERCLALHVKNPAWLPWRALAATALDALGEHDQALGLSEEELWRARRFGAPRPLGIALRVRGLIEAGEQGLELLRESASVLQSAPARLQYAATLVALGAAIRRTGQRVSARKTLTEGLALASECGATALAAHAQTELKATGARPRSITPTGAASLTASERRVCEMAAAGMSNPAIAQALFITRGTVESHLHAAYGKLGIAGRTELRAVLDHVPR